MKANQPDLGLAVIDYLQLIKPPAGSSGVTWSIIVGEIVRNCGDLSGELDVPIILISAAESLSRKPG